jgi:hypothetical protein
MARRSRMAVLKRQREVRKAEKAARKRAKRHGIQEERFAEPQPTVRVGDLPGPSDTPGESDDADSGHAADTIPSKEEQS